MVTDAVRTGSGSRRLRLPIGLALAFLLTLAIGAAQPAFATSSLYWSFPAVIDAHSVNGLTCPSASLCVGLDYVGDVVTSTDPTGGSSAWWVARIDDQPETPYTEPNALNDVSCPPPAGSLCVAVGAGGIFTSTDPTGGAQAWTVAGGIGEHAQAVSCPSASLCVVGFGYYGEILTSTDPTGGSGAWEAAKVDSGQQIVALVCPSRSLCVGLDSAGNLLTSTNPTGGANAWTVEHLASAGFAGLACTSVSFCIIADGSNVLSSTDPASGAGAWTLQREVLPKNASFGKSACASPSLCVVTGSNGNVAESTDPTGGARAWVGAEDLDGTNDMSGVACVSESLCLLTDEAVVIGVPASNLSVAVHGMGAVTSTPIACPFGCTYSGPACPRNCGGGLSNAFVGQRLAEISCLEQGWHGGVNGGTCSLAFPAENTVTLTAAPAQGWTFTGWTGNCSASTNCSVPMSSDRAVTATFAAASRRPVPPTLTNVAQTHRRWREARARGHIDTMKRNDFPIGTTFSFGLNEPASVTLSFTQRINGRRVGRACLSPTAKNRARPACMRTITVGALSLAGHSGANRIAFRGSISRSRRLKPGSYTLAITATSSAGARSAPRSLRFTIVK